jgi:endonuclease YncB( thermonuclease family)
MGICTSKQAVRENPEPKKSADESQINPHVGAASGPIRDGGQTKKVAPDSEVTALCVETETDCPDTPQDPSDPYADRTPGEFDISPTPTGRTETYEKVSTSHLQSVPKVVPVTKWTGPMPPEKSADVLARVGYVFDAADHVYRTGQVPPEPPFSKGVFTRWYKGRVKLGKVYDGDTFTIGTLFRIPLKVSGAQGARIVTPSQHPTGDLFLEVPAHIRMFGYNSPEIRCPKSLAPEARESMKASAVAARDALSNLCQDTGPLDAIFVGTTQDKYGRCLCVLYLPNGLNVNRWMLEHGYGVPYDAQD